LKAFFHTGLFHQPFRFFFCLKVSTYFQWDSAILLTVALRSEVNRLLLGLFLDLGEQTPLLGHAPKALLQQAIQTGSLTGSCVLIRYYYHQRLRLFKNATMLEKQSRDAVRSCRSLTGVSPVHVVVSAALVFASRRLAVETLSTCGRALSVSHRSCLFACRGGISRFGDCSM
jgi:hypothetical protein